jgi:hypothetical protein
MQDIKLDDLDQVTGGAGWFQNMGTSAEHKSNRWANGTLDALGRNPIGYVAGGVAGIFGGLVGLGQGTLHTIDNRVPLK